MLALLVTSPVILAALIGGVGLVEAPTAPSEMALGEIPAGLLPVYMAAAATCPGLPWQVLAGIGSVESGHGGGRYDPSTGDVKPPIMGPPLDGRPGFAAIADTRQPDGWAHGLGPMQFLSTTWTRWATLAPGRPPGSVPDVDNAWDAIHSAARYLCGGRQRIDDIDAALLRYNRSPAYVREVMAKAAAYGLGSGSSVTGSGEAVASAGRSSVCRTSGKARNPASPSTARDSCSGPTPRSA